MVQLILSKSDQILFGPRDIDDDVLIRIVTASAIVLLYLSGIFHWMFFYQFGNMSFDLLDWGDGLFYYEAATDMVTEFSVPYFSDATAPAWPDTRFLGNPQSFLTPQVILFPLMSVGEAVIFNTIFMYTIGFIGIMMIRNHFGLSLIPFTLLFLLFNFNGHLTSHLSVGHSMWNGYFLLPFFFLVLLKLPRENLNPGIQAPIVLSLILLGIIMQGSFHIFVWCLMFLAIVGLVHRRYLKQMVLGILFGVSLSLFRLIPAALVSSDHEAAYASGYPNLSTLVDAFTTIKTFQFEHVRNLTYYNVGWHEQDIYIGYIGLAFILYFGVYQRFISKSQDRESRFQLFDLPMALFFLMSMGFVFDLISDLQIPLISTTERVPSRFLIMPLIAITFISAIRMQSLLPLIRNNATAKVLCLVGIGLLAHNLGAHSWFWQLNAVHPGALQSSLDITFDRPSGFESTYVAVVNVSILLSVLSALAIAGLFVWSRRAK